MGTGDLSGRWASVVILKMKILIRGTNWIGDAVMTIPALRALRRIFPNERIYLHSHSGPAELLADTEFVDEFIIINRSGSKMLTVINEARRLKQEKFDLAILFTNSWESALTVRLAGIPVRLGYASDRRGFLLSDPIPVPEWKVTRHEVFYYLNLAAAVEGKYLGTRSITDESPSTDISISSKRQDSAKDLLRSLGVKFDRPVVGLGIGSTNSRAKRWPAGSFAQLADKLKASLNADLLLLGSNGDRSVADEVIANSNSNLIDLTGKTNVSEAAAVLCVIDLMVSNDMGLAHVSPAVGTQTLVIFGPTDPVTTRPFSDNAEVIRREVDCSPCMLRDCPIDHRCMINISADDILTKALHKLRLHERK